jgi:hypothetical protein
MAKGNKMNTRRSYTPLLLSIASLCWLSLGLLGVEVGLRGVRDIVILRMQDATDVYNATRNEYTAKVMIEHRLEALQSYSLEPSFLETHTQCLARAITFADKAYSALPYGRYPAIVNATTEWAEDTCGKLVFTPQIAQPSVLWKSVRTVRETTMHAYQWAKKASIDSVSWVTKWILSRLSRQDLIEQFEHRQMQEEFERTLQEWSTLNDVLSQKALERRIDLAKEALSVQLPPHYALNCSGSLVCRLSYKANSSLGSALTHSDIQKANEAAETAIRLSVYDQCLIKASSWVLHILLLVLLVQAVVLSTFFILYELRHTYLRGRDVSTRIQEQRTVALLLTQVSLITLQLVRPLHSQMPALCISIGVLTVFLGILGMIRAVKELDDIWAGWEDIMLSTKVKNFVLGMKDRLNRKNPDEPVPSSVGRKVEKETTVSAEPPKPLSRVVDFSRRISSRTSLYEDIQEELHRQRMGEDQPKIGSANSSSTLQAPEDTLSDSDTNTGSDEILSELEDDEHPVPLSYPEADSDWSVVGNSSSSQSSAGDV